MIRKNEIRLDVAQPDVGLITSVPSNLPDKKWHRAVVAGENFRADYGVLRSAPGYESVIVLPEGLDSPPNLIFQTSFTNSESSLRTPVVGTSSSLYAVNRQSRAVVCNEIPCSVESIWVVGDTGRAYSPDGSGETAVPASLVAKLVFANNPSAIIHVGGLIHTNADAPGDSPHFPIYEDQVGRHYYKAIGGYSGTFGQNSSENIFFPTVGEYEWTAANGGANAARSIDAYGDFFSVSGTTERYYTYKRGPIQFFHFSGIATEPAGVAYGSTQGAWLREAITASDCPWRIVVVHFPPYTSETSKSPGQASLQWIVDFAGVSAVLCGRSQCSEIVEVPNKPPVFISGNGGIALQAQAGGAHPNTTFYNSTYYGALRIDADFKELKFRLYRTDENLGTLLATRTLTTPELVGTVCYVDRQAKTPTSLKISPLTAVVEAGGRWPFQATLFYADGSSKNVSNFGAAWASSNTAVATIGANSGVATGSLHGTVTISATYEGIAASPSASLSVLTHCVGPPRNIMLVIDRSAPMGISTGAGSTWTFIQEGVARFFDGITPLDKVGLVTYAGNFTDQTSDASLDVLLGTDTKARILSRLDSIVPGGATSTANALRTAFAGLSAESPFEKYIILVTGGYPNVVEPEGTANASYEDAVIMAKVQMEAIVATIKTAKMTLITVGHGVTGSEGAYLGLRASAGLNFMSFSAEELSRALAHFTTLLCQSGVYSGTGYVPSCGAPKLDFTGFTNWDVVQGVVDLVGTAAANPNFSVWDVFPTPAHGLYVDLRGTVPSKNQTNFSTEGAIETKDPVALVNGASYMFQLDIAGNGRQDRKGFSLKVSVLGGHFSQIVKVDDYLQPFSTYKFFFTAASTASAKLRIEQLPGPDHVYNTVGLLIDNVKFEKLTAPTAVLFEDDFDAENPCP